jgi:hypothetical protein
MEHSTGCCVFSKEHCIFLDYLYVIWLRLGNLLVCLALTYARCKQYKYARIVLWALSSRAASIGPPYYIREHRLTFLVYSPLDP